MPRAKANPDPQVVTHARADLPGVVFTIEAFRDGRYVLKRGEKVIGHRVPQLGSYFGAPMYPSNRLQDEAIKDARKAIDWMGPHELE